MMNRKIEHDRQPGKWQTFPTLSPTQFHQVAGGLKTRHGILS
jgi:hypothetical protein